MQLNSSDDCVHRYTVETLNDFDPELQLINIKPMTKTKFKQLLSGLKKFKVWAILVSEYKKRNNRKIFNPYPKLIARNSDIDKAFRFVH